jgi:hypothetical protein
MGVGAVSRPPNLRHAVLHLQAYLGEVAKIAEMLDPDDGQVEGERAREAARAHFVKRFANGRGPGHWDVCLDVVEAEVRRIMKEPAQMGPEGGGRA